MREHRSARCLRREPPVQAPAPPAPLPQLQGAVASPRVLAPRPSSQAQRERTPLNDAARGDLVRRCQSPALCSRDKTRSHVALRSAQHKCSERWHYKCHAFHRKEEASLHLPPLCIFHKWRLLQTPPPPPALPDLYFPLSSRTVFGGLSHRQPSRRNALCIVDSCSLSATISRRTRNGKCACNCRSLPPCRPAPEAASKHHKSFPQLHCKTSRSWETRQGGHHAPRPAGSLHA
mmetsp:Transcript_58407/g.92488  ORF Transcript_58407/g.92488 Transcript_58407/m.92488 type:complete len:233 (-) Transcript_58407:89-787(-)